MKAINTSGCVGLERKKFVKELLLKVTHLFNQIGAHEPLHLFSQKASWWLKKKVPKLMESESRDP
jgi:hypothetical protein